MRESEVITFTVGPETAAVPLSIGTRIEIKLIANTQKAEKTLETNLTVTPAHLAFGRISIGYFVIPAIVIACQCTEGLNGHNREFEG